MRLNRLSLSIFCLALLPFTTTEAQGLGRLVKKAKEKATESVSKTLDGNKKAAADSAKSNPDSAKGKVVEATSKSSSDNTNDASAKTSVPAETSVAKPAPAVETPLAVTAETIDLFLGVLKADAARHSAVLAWVKGNATYRACRDRVTRQPQTVPPDQKAAQVAADRVAALQARWKAMWDVPPAERNHQAMDFLRDTINYARELQNTAYYPAMAKCGTPVIPPTGFQMSGERESSERAWRPADPSPVLPSGMSRKQYALLRERIGAWLMSKQTLGAPLIAPDETAVLKARVADLTPYTDYFAFRVMPYLHWSDTSHWK